MSFMEIKRFVNSGTVPLNTLLGTEIKKINSDEDKALDVLIRELSNSAAKESSVDEVEGLLKNTDYGLSALKSAIGSSLGGGSDRGTKNIKFIKGANPGTSMSDFATVLDVVGAGRLYNAYIDAYASSSVGQTLKIIADDKVVVWVTITNKSSNSNGWYNGGLYSTRYTFSGYGSSGHFTLSPQDSSRYMNTLSLFEISSVEQLKSVDCAPSRGDVRISGLLIPDFISFEKSLKIMFKNSYRTECYFYCAYDLDD